MDVVLKHGTWFFGRADVIDYEVTTAWQKRRRPRAQECFYNAQTFCLDHPEYSYWEGYYLIPGIPMHHAWVVMQDGRVVDFTLEAVLRKAKRECGLVDKTPPLYLGINVPRSFLLQRILDSNESQGVAELYHAQHPAKRRRT